MNKFRYFNFSLCRESPTQVAGDFPCVGKVPRKLQETFPVQGKSLASCRRLSLCRESPLQVAGDFPCVGKVPRRVAGDFPCVGKVPCRLQETFPV